MNVSSRIGKQQGAQVQNWKEKAARGAGTMFQEFVLNILEKCDEKYNEDMGNAEVKMKILADVIKEQNRKIAELEATVHGHRTQAPVTTVSANFGIGQTQLSAFHGQDENAGMFFERTPRYISHGGKKYEGRVALAECNLHVAGRPMGEEFVMEGTTYTKYTKNGVVKLIQEKDPFLLEFEGRNFFKSITQGN